MEAFLGQPPHRRAELCELAADELGLAPGAVEKDFWVCWVLRELFRLEVGPHLTLKGGTSLSKCWGLIKRFSEDLDLVVDREILGFAEGAAPKAASSGRERRRRVEAIGVACTRYVSETLLPALDAAIRNRQSALTLSVLSLDPDAVDQQTIKFEYESLFQDVAYLRPVVKIELGARSDTEPIREPSVTPYVASAPASGLGDCSFKVRAVAPERTFWEKVSLLHEEAYGATGPRMRLARHYYDLWCLDQQRVAASALAMLDLFQRVVEHRRLFFRRGGDAQRDLVVGSVRLVPAAERMQGWQADFEAMRETMFFEDPPSFDMIMSTMRNLERRINRLPPEGA